MKILSTTLLAAAVFTLGLSAKADPKCLKQVNEVYGKNRAACNKMKGNNSGKQECYRQAARQKDADKKNCK
jgi:hypothetical protein